MNTRAGILATFVAATACGTALTPRGRVVLVESTPLPECELVGQVIAEVSCTPSVDRLTQREDTSHCRDDAVVALRNRAADGGANLIVVTASEHDDTGAWRATADGYLCSHRIDPTTIPAGWEGVAVLRRAEEASACRLVSAVTASGSMTKRVAELQERALVAGGNSVLVEEHGARESVGMAYLCPREAGTPEVELEPAAPPPKRTTRKVIHRDRLDQPMAMLVLELGAIGVDQRVSTLMTDILLAEFGRVRELRALGMADVEAMLDLQRRRDLLACESTACMAEIGGALGAQLVLRGRIGNLGSKFVVNLTVIDTARSRVVVRINETLERDEDELAPAAPKLVGDVVYQINRGL